MPTEDAEIVEKFTVLHVVNSLEVGGAENQLLSLVSAQVPEDRVVILTLKKANLPSLEGVIKEFGIEIFTFSKRSPLKNLQLFSMILNEYRPDVIHSHLFRSEIIIAIYSLLLPNLQSKLIVTRHIDAGYIESLPRISRLFSYCITSKYAKVIAISGAVRDFLRTTKQCRSEKIVEINYGFDKDMWVKNQLKIRRANVQKYKGNPRVLLVGRLVKQKNIEVVMMALKELQALFPNISLVLVGSGPMEQDLNLMAQRLGIQERVHFVGKQARVLDFYRECDVFILPSLHEGFGMVYMEAMALEIPILTSRNKAAETIFPHNYAGFFNPSNHLEIVELIDKLFRNNLVLNLDVTKVFLRFSKVENARLHREVYQKQC